MSEVIEVTVKGRSGSGKAVIVREIAEVLADKGITCVVETLENLDISPERHAERVNNFASCNRIVVVREVQANRDWSGESNIS